MAIGKYRPSPFMVIQIRDRPVQPEGGPYHGRVSPCPAAISRFHCGRYLPHRCYLQLCNRPSIPPNCPPEHSGVLAKRASVKCVCTQRRSMYDGRPKLQVLTHCAFICIFCTSNEKCCRSRALYCTLIITIKRSWLSKHLGGADAAKACVSVYGLG